MDKEEYRERVLKALEEIRRNTDVTGFFVIVADIFLIFIIFMVLFK